MIESNKIKKQKLNNKNKIDKLQTKLTNLQYQSNLLLRQLFEVQIQLDELDDLLKNKRLLLNLNDNKLNYNLDQNYNRINNLGGDSINQDDLIKNQENSLINNQNNNLINNRNDNPINNQANNVINNENNNSIKNNQDNLNKKYDKLIKYINKRDEILLNELSNEFKLNNDNLIKIINKLLKEGVIEGYLLSDRFIHFTKDQLYSSCKIIKEYCIQNYIKLYTDSFINLLRLKIKDRDNLKDKKLN